MTPLKHGDLVTSAWDDPAKPEHRARVLGRDGVWYTLAYVDPDGSERGRFQAHRDDIRLVLP